MFLIDNITSFISKCKAQRAASNAAERKQFAERDALARFNISSFDGKPVILYGDVVISVPNDKTTGDSLIQSMLKLREIYVQSKCNNGQKLEKVKDSYFRYIELSQYLFGSGDAAVYDVNEIPADNKFYQLARDLANSMNISWESMTHEESNRIMLAMLDDCYNAMSKGISKKDKSKLVIDINFQLLK